MDAPLAWLGGCVTGCKQWNDCGMHEDDPCGTSSRLTLPETQGLVESLDWNAVAVAVAEGLVDLDEGRGVLYVLSCSTGSITGQLPLAQPQLIVDALAQLQDGLLKEVLRQ